MTTDDDVMFQGKWLDVYGDGSYLITEDLAKQIQDSPPKPGTLYGRPIVIEDNREHPGNCHNGPSTVAGLLAKMLPSTHQCPATRAAIEANGLTRNGACPTIRNPKKDRP